MSTPYFTPIPSPVQNTAWKGPDTTANSVAFEEAFIIEVVCAWCGDHLSGPVGGPKTSHGICQACKDKLVGGL